MSVTTPITLDVGSITPIPSTGVSPARLTQITGAATLTLKSNPPGEGRLVSVFRHGGTSSIEPVRFTSKDEKEKEKETKLQEKIGEIWNKAKSALPAGATKLRIQLSQPTVVIVYTAPDGTIHRLDKERTDQDFYALVKEVKDLSRDLFRKVYFSPQDSNRLATGQSHLMICSDHWRSQQPDSLREYLSPKGKLGFVQLYPHLTDGNEALDRIVATERFILEMEHSIAVLLNHNQQELDQPNLVKERRQELLRTNRSLTQLRSQFHHIDRHAIFSAVGFWGNTDPLTPTEADRLKKASDLSNLIAGTLKRELQPGVDTRRWYQRVKDTFTGSYEGDLRVKMSPYVNEYAQEAGDLLLHDKHQQAARAEEGDRGIKNASVEEFIVHNMIHIGMVTPDPGTVGPGSLPSGEDTFDGQAAIDELGIELDSTSQAALTQFVKQSRINAAQIRIEMSRIAASNWEKRVVAAKKVKIV